MGKKGGAGPEYNMVHTTNVVGQEYGKGRRKSQHNRE